MRMRHIIEKACFLRACPINDVVSWLGCAIPHLSRHLRRDGHIRDHPEHRSAGHCSGQQVVHESGLFLLSCRQTGNPREPEPQAGEINGTGAERGDQYKSVRQNSSRKTLASYSGP